MSKNVLIRAVKLVESLSPREKIAVINFINSTRKENSRKSKLLDLFMELEAGKPAHGHNRKLLELLEDRVLDCLLLDMNLMNGSKYKNNKLASLAFEKESIKSRLLLSKGVVKRSFDVAENCLKKAKTSESFDTILLLLNQQASMISFHRNESDFFKKVAEIDHFENCRAIKSKAVRLYRELCIKKYHNIRENIDLFLDNSLTQLRSYSKKATFSTLEFVILYFEKEKHELQNDVIQSLNITIDLYSKCNENSEIPLIFNIYELVYEQARLVFELGRASESVFLLKKCISHLPKENVACQKAYELLFLLQYLEKNFIGAHDTLVDIKSSVFFEQYVLPDQKCLWYYYEACLYFSLGQYRKSIHALSASESVNLSDLDKFRQRLVAIMAHIEMENHDEADHLIEASRRFIYRKGLKPQLKESGLEIFLDLLISLKQVGYDFFALSSKTEGFEGKLQALKTSKNKYSHLNLWLMEYDLWTLQRLQEKVSESKLDFQNWEALRREQYFNTGKVQRIYFR